MKRLKGIDGKLDKAWSELVKLKAGYMCEFCHAKDKQLHSHHIYSRSNRATRWSASNGVCLCAGHHVLSSTFSAHKTPVEFTEWLYEVKGSEFMNRLRVSAKGILKLKAFEKEFLLRDLLEQINNLKTIEK